MKASIHQPSSTLKFKTPFRAAFMPLVPDASSGDWGVAKHNEVSGEENRDGLNENYSEINSMEGTSDDQAIEAIRPRQIKNMLTSLGPPREFQ